MIAVGPMTMRDGYLGAIQRHDKSLTVPTVQQQSVELHHGKIMLGAQIKRLLRRKPPIWLPEGAKDIALMPLHDGALAPSFRAVFEIILRNQAVSRSGRRGRGCTFIAPQHVVPAAALQHISPGAAREGVISLTAGERIIAAGSFGRLGVVAASHGPPLSMLACALMFAKSFVRFDLDAVR